MWKQVPLNLLELEVQLIDVLIAKLSMCPLSAFTTEPLVDVT